MNGKYFYIMNAKLAKLLIITLLVLCSACSNGVKKTLGLQGEAPNEFTVISNQPLIVPPNFNLRPLNDEQDVPESEIIIQSKSAANLSKGSLIFLEDAGVSVEDKKARALTKAEHKDYDPDEDKNVIERVIDVGQKQKNAPMVLDAQAEKARIDQNKQENKNILEGDTPMNKEKHSVINTIVQGEED